MKPYYSLCLIALCLTFTSSLAQEDPIVPLDIGNTWIYAVENEGFFESPEGGRTTIDFRGTETWTVVGDSVNKNGEFKVIRITGTTPNHRSWSNNQLVQVNDVRMRFSLGYCNDTEMEYWGDYINLGEESTTYNDSLVCAFDDFSEFSDVLNVGSLDIDSDATIFNRAGRAQQRTYDAYLFEASRRHSFTTLPHFGILAMDIQERTFGGGAGALESSKVLRGAIIDGTHYGDTDVSTDLPPVSSNGGISADGTFQIFAYPNPVESELHLEIYGRGNEFAVRLVDMTGRRVATIARGIFVDDRPYQFLKADLGTTPTGAYFAVLVIDDIPRTHCLIQVK